MLLDAYDGSEPPLLWSQKRALGPSPGFQELALRGAADPARFRATRNRGNFTYFVLNSNVRFKRGLWRCGQCLVLMRIRECLHGSVFPDGVSEPPPEQLLLPGLELMRIVTYLIG